MKKLILTLFVASMGIVAAEAQQRDGTYQDQNGDYHYETRERQVWVPEQKVGGVFGIGSKTIPGHYETRQEQVKVYNDDYGSEVNQGGTKGWQGRHPHGMPPGQRKKMQGNRDGSWDRNRDRDRSYDPDDDERNYPSGRPERGRGKGPKHN